MTAGDRAATEAYLEDLHSELRALAVPPQMPAKIGAWIAYTVDARKIRSLSAEIAEVKRSLATGRLPFQDDK
jgi:hypothetical protein